MIIGIIFVELTYTNIVLHLIRIGIDNEADANGTEDTARRE